MKFTTAVALAMGMAPLALAKSVHNAYPVRRDGERGSDRDGRGRVEKVQKADKSERNSKKASEADLAELSRLIGLNRGNDISINFLWVNVGGGAATTVLGSASTVTVTQTVAGEAAATAPPAETTAEAAVTTAAPPRRNRRPAAAATHSVAIKAAIGDTVIFTFLSQNHTATQSAFDTPARLLPAGWILASRQTPTTLSTPTPSRNARFYCRQANHCGKGMVFSINPSAEKTQAQFQALAIQQNGDGAGGAITGNAPPAADNGAAASSVAVPAESAVATGGEAAATATEAAATGGEAAATATGEAAAATSGVVIGNGQVGADGSCVCAVQCSFPGFPNGQVQEGVDPPAAKRFRA
ncbi:hypothetical protein N0V88_000506 [Collariella sp. IMI 366227]|nr:hypothetical protein N0V88_000506 [Collariella sp. IMI 366227]